MVTLTPSSPELSTFNLTWNSQQNHVLEGIKGLFGDDDDDLLLTDVTLACDGEYMQAHKLVLSICSFFFKDLFKKNKTDKSNTIIVLGQVTPQNLKYLLQFIYQGKVDIPSAAVDSFLEAGKMLKIEGLAAVQVTPNDGHSVSNSHQVQIDSRVETNMNTAPTPSAHSVRRQTRSHVAPSSSSVNIPAAPESSSRLKEAGPLKKPRLSEPAVSEPSSIELNPALIPESDPPEDPFHDFEHYDEEIEQPIQLDSVKSEPIEVYTGFVNDPVTEHSDTYGASEDTESYPVIMSPSCLVTDSFFSPAATNLPNTSSRSQLTASAKGKAGFNRKQFTQKNVATSLVWRYYDKLDESSLRCKLCFRHFKFDLRSTSNIRGHLRSLHRKEFDEMEEMRLGR